jgi:hypothetical protein
MKIGDTVDVFIAGQVVAQAKIVETAEGTATLIIPGTQVVMATSTELTTAPVVEQSKQVIIEGADRVDSDGNVVPAPEPVETSIPVKEAETVQPAPVEEKAESDVNVNEDTNTEQ